MPAGQWLTRKIRCGDPPDDLRARVLATLTPQLRRAGLHLIEPGDPTLLYQRRYVPAGPLLLGVLLLAVSAYPIVHVLSSDARISLALAAVVVGALLLALSRRSETLAVTVMAQAGGSVAIVEGYATESARLSIQHWNPPRVSRLRVAPPWEVGGPR